MATAVGAGEPGSAGVPIQDVSRLLGVPAPTIRSWERRYGLPSTSRSAGGHRRYPESALRELRLMRDAIAQGRKASEAARMVRALLDDDDPARQRVAGLVEASGRLDTTAVRAVLDQAQQEVGLAAAVDTVLMPAMRQIGSLWEMGRCDVAQEHLTTEAARAWLSRVTALAPPPGPGLPLLLACGPRDLHTLGLEALAALLIHERRACRVLGARTPANTLLAASTATDAAGVVVISHLSAQRGPAVEAIRVVARSGVPVFYAGNAFVFPGARTGVPGTYLGESIGAAVEIIRRAVPD